MSSADELGCCCGVGWVGLGNLILVGADAVVDNSVEAVSVVRVDCDDVVSVVFEWAAAIVVGATSVDAAVKAVGVSVLSGSERLAETAGDVSGVHRLVVIEVLGLASTAGIGMIVVCTGGGDSAWMVDGSGRSSGDGGLGPRAGCEAA